MDRYVLLLRAVNVGGKNRLPMQELRLLLQQAGYQGVQSYIQSGNIILCAASNPLADVAKLIADNFGFEAQIIALVDEDFVQAAKANPFTAGEPKTIHCYFCQQQPNLDLQKIEVTRDPSESYQVVGNTFYLHAPNGIGRSKLVKNIEACLGVSSTGRNLNTVNKLCEMLRQ
ncbi:DUF1697 domain-containing protein [Alginatibacterium sediminis]|uniref:DUF1697 domain-containing protein n=1 Tax=Alginatibacterium sediminis TaxID=2164068 RepID=A0A420EBI6_9ALTE|nr:DUF1697 domain-containing protein [Alginatibacterium sediminis]RKF18002.1 DUF1697 domain-containing protein [Alginatibacterium sediminis]